MKILVSTIFQDAGEAILRTVEKVLSVESYKDNVLSLKKHAKETDTERIIGETFWNFVLALR